MAYKADGWHLGDYVEDDYGRKGRIYELHYGCPESEEWIKAQCKPVSAQERNVRWASILVHNSGAIASPVSRLIHIDAFPFCHRDMADFFTD